MAYNGRINAFWAEIHRTQRDEFQRSRAREVANSINGVTAEGMVNISRAYPHMSPGVVRALGQAGYDPDNPAVVYAAYMEAARQGASALGFNRAYGDRLDFTGFSGRLKEFALSQRDPREVQALTELGIGPGSPRVAQGQMAEAQRLDPFGTKETGVDRNRVLNERIQRDRAAMNQMGIRYQPRAFEQMSEDELVAIASSMPVLQSPTGGEPEHLSEESIREMLGEDRDQLIEWLERSMKPREGWQRSPMQIASEALSRVEPTANEMDQQLGGVPVFTQAYSGLKTLTRTAGAAAQYPFQEANSIIRNIYGMATGEIDPFAPVGEQEAYQEMGESTDIGIMIEGAVEHHFGTGEKIDTGQGFFIDPDTEVARVRRSREILAGNIGGHAVTPGRLFANIYSEPDTEPFNITSGIVDAGFAWFADPVGMVPVSQITRARRTFQVGKLDPALEAAGLVNGHRKYTNPTVFDQWVLSHPNEVRFFTDTKDPYLIDRARGFQLGPEASQRLARTNSDEQTIATMRSLVNKGKVRQTTQFTGSLPHRLKNKYNEVRQSIQPEWQPQTNRLFDRMPGQFIYLRDKRQVAEQLRRMGVNANLPEEVIQQAYNMVARSNGKHQTLAAAQFLEKNIHAKLIEEGAGAPAELVSLRDVRVREDLRELVESLSSQNPNPIQIIVNGQPIEIGDIHHTLNTLSDYWHVAGDPRAIRRQTSPFKVLTTKHTLGPVVPGVLRRKKGVPIKTPNGELRIPFSMAESGMGFLKATWLLRPAWPVRFLAEEQIRIANSPLDITSWFDHPVKALAIHQGRRYQTDPLGNPFEDMQEFHYAQIRGHGGWAGDKTAVPRGEPRVFARNNPKHQKDFDYNWANHLAELQQHPVVNHLLNNSREDTMNWLLKGQGRQILAQQRANYGGLKNRRQIEGWLTTISDNIDLLTRGNTDLVNAVRTGVYQGAIPIYLSDMTVNPGWRKIVAAHHDVSAPEFVNGVRFTMKKTEMDGVMDRIWGALYQFPANRFSREPHFKQSLWANTRELIGGATRTAQKNILANARAAGIKGEEYRRLELAAQRAKGRMSAEEIVNLAKGYALDDTKQLLYDLTERRQWADIARIIVPFGDAYQEIIQSWSRLITAGRGKPVYRLKQIVEAARETGTGDTLGTGVEGGGFFWEDEFGTEMFNYPLSGQLSSWLTGVHTPLAGRVQGLNMVGNFIPGLGPVAQIPAAMFIDKYKDLEPLRDFLVPFGAPGSGETDIENPLNYGPAWLRKFWQWASNGNYNQRLYNNQVMAAYSYLISTGAYGSTTEELQRAMDDAFNSVNGKFIGSDWKIGIFGLTALGSFILPASPSPRELIEDDSGTLVSIAAISKDYWERVDNDGYDEANGWFLSNFGEDAIGAVVPRTVSVAAGIPRSVEQGEWWKAHPSLASQYPQVYGLFGPQGGEFDYGTYIESVLSGKRQTITPQDFMRVMNDWMGNYWYGRVREDTGGDNPTDEQRDIRSAAAEQIRQDYPYWDGKPGTAGLPRKAEPDDLIREMQRAIKNPELAETEVGQALTFYFEARDLAQTEVEWYNTEYGTSYTSFREANDLAYIREYLRGVAADLIEDYPDFENTWDIVLNRELSEDSFLRN